MQHTRSVENYKRSHAGERIRWFIGIICFCVKATGTAHTKLMHLLLLMTDSFRTDFIVDWYFYQSWYKMALPDNVYGLSSVFLHFPNSKSDVTILANGPGSLWWQSPTLAGSVWSGACQSSRSLILKSRLLFNTAIKILFLRPNNIADCLSCGCCSIELRQ